MKKTIPNHARYGVCSYCKSTDWVVPVDYFSEQTVCANTYACREMQEHSKVMVPRLYRSFADLVETQESVEQDYSPSQAECWVDDLPAVFRTLLNLFHGDFLTEEECELRYRAHTTERWHARHGL